MIKYTKGNILDTPTQVLVNPVNCVGVMGKGLALEVKQKYPAMFLAYKDVCSKGFKPGMLHVYAYAERIIVNFPTKVHWRDKSKLEYIELGLQAFCTYSFYSASFPKLGCGLGGLDWSEVKPLMENYLSTLNTDILIYE